jgi:GDP-mannose pyrophosphatase NudK
LLSGNWYKLYKVDFQIKGRNGEWLSQSRECYDRGNGATILLYNTVQKTVILTKQFRMPTYVNGNDTGMLVEACAGLLDADSPEECIRRETEEETGYKISRPEKVFELYMSPGSVTEILYFFIAEYSKEQKISEGGGVDEHEDIDVLELPFAKALEMVRSGEIKDAKTVILLQHLQLKGII